MASTSEEVKDKIWSLVFAYVHDVDEAIRVLSRETIEHWTLFLRKVDWRFSEDVKLCHGSLWPTTE